MATVEIFYRQVRMQTTSFQGNFVILEDYSTKEIFWDDGKQENPRAGIVKNWIRFAAGGVLSMLRPLPSWDLVINGEKAGAEFNDQVDLRGKIVELQHGDYRFVFQFDT